MEIIFVPLLLLGNAFFVGTEFALTRVRQFSESEFEEGALKLAWTMTEQMEIYLSGCQFGITIMSIGLGVVGEPVLTSAIQQLGHTGAELLSLPGLSHAVSATIAFGILNALHVVIGEQAPTYLGIEKTKLICRYGAPLLYGWTTVMYPFIRLSDLLAKGLLRLFGVEIERSWAMDEAVGYGALKEQMGDILHQSRLPSDRRLEVLNALKLDEIEVQEIMVPWEEVRTLDVGQSQNEQEAVLRRNAFNRLPLMEEGEPVGVVYTTALLQQLEEHAEGKELDLVSAAAPAFFVPADLTVSELIDQMQDEQQELALVRQDEDVVGLVTETDAFEEVVGELRDPLE